MVIRQATIEDLDSICEIEKQSMPRPWGYTLFRTDLLSNLNAMYWVAEDCEVVGFIGIHDIVGEINITNVAVRPDKRQMGIGRLLMQAMLDYYEGKNIIGITLEVRASNTPAIHLYESLGFISEGIRKAYYQDGEDALIMWKRKD